MQGKSKKELGRREEEGAGGKGRAGGRLEWWGAEGRRPLYLQWLTAQRLGYQLRNTGKQPV